MSVTINQPLPTDPKALRKLKKREVLEQTRIALIESLKNHPDKWIHIAETIGIIGLSIQHSIDTRGNSQGAVLGGFAKGIMVNALLTQQMSDIQAAGILGAVGIQELLDFYTGGRFDLSRFREGTLKIVQAITGTTTTTTVGGLPFLFSGGLGSLFK